MSKKSRLTPEVKEYLDSLSEEEKEALAKQIQSALKTRSPKEEEALKKRFGWKIDKRP